VLAWALGMLLSPRCGAAEEWAPYRPEREVDGAIRIWGSLPDGWLIEHLEAGFRRFQPRVTFSEALHGPESTFAGVYTGVADLAFMAREMRVPMESMAFEWVHHYKAFEVEIANAGLGPQRPGVSLAVFVHKTNPLQRLTLRQLDGIFGAEHRRGGRNMRRWADLAGEDGWKDRPIHVYGPPLDDVATLFIRTRVLLDSHKWNPSYREIPAGWGAVLASVARDPDGIAFAPPVPGNDRAKVIELAADDGGAFYALTPQTVAARTYPLTRVISVALDRKAGEPLDPKLREFLRYLLSREGQEAVTSDGVYLPLSAQSAQRQLHRLD
jgi:phosphate transport system substrate-binding protein